MSFNDLAETLERSPTMQNYHLPPEMLPEGHRLQQNLVRTLTVIPNEPVLWTRAMNCCNHDAPRKELGEGFLLLLPF